jgi:hypothetical protein
MNWIGGNRQMKTHVELAGSQYEVNIEKSRAKGCTWSAEPSWGNACKLTGEDTMRLSPGGG